MGTMVLAAIPAILLVTILGWQRWRRYLHIKHDQEVTQAVWSAIQRLYGLREEVNALSVRKRIHHTQRPEITIDVVCNKLDQMVGQGELERYAPGPDYGLAPASFAYRFPDELVWELPAEADQRGVVEAIRYFEQYGVPATYFALGEPTGFSDRRLTAVLAKLINRGLIVRQEVPAPANDTSTIGSMVVYRLTRNDAMDYTTKPTPTE